MEDNPFPELDIEDTSVLDLAEHRVVCSNCGRKRMYFCYSCIRYVNNLEDTMPKVKLPVKIDIIKHKKELDSKSTAVHAALLAPQECNVYTFPDVPTYNPETDVVIYPSVECLSVEQWASLPITSGESESEDSKKRRVVFIDCTWNQTHVIITSPQLAGLPRIGMNSYSTKFWRPNGSKRNESHLATVEAIYYFLKEYHTLYLRLDYTGQYDNLLMIFKYMYSKIKDFHNGGDKLKAYRKT